jgi:hypothetical protein
MKNKLVKLGLFGLSLLLALACLCGCLIDLGGGVPPSPGNQLIVAVNPLSGYPPLLVTLEFSGVTEGQYTITVEGHTYTQGSNIKRVTLHSLPCEGEVIWERPGYATQRAQFYIALDNEGPVIGRLRLNGLDDLWYLHPRQRYIADNPDAYDPEGGPVTLVDVHVQVARKLEEDTVFCPPYAGPGVYHAFDRNRRMIENAFVFHCTWTGPIDVGTTRPEWVQSHSYKVANRIRFEQRIYTCIKKHVADEVNRPPTGTSWQVFWVQSGWVDGTDLPFSPPGYAESGYPGNGTNCPIGWPTVSAPATITTITMTYRDQDGAETTESWDLPTGPDPGCNIY